MFRVLRLAEKYSLWIPKKLFSAIQSYRPALLNLNSDHLGVELHKLFTRANSIPHMLTLLESSGILFNLLPCVASSPNYYLLRPQLITHLEELKIRPTHYTATYATLLYIPTFTRFLEIIQFTSKTDADTPKTIWEKCVSEIVDKQTAHHPLTVLAVQTIKDILLSQQPVPLQPQLDSRTLPKQSL